MTKFFSISLIFLLSVMAYSQYQYEKDEALTMLKEGNKRFVAGISDKSARQYPHLDADRIMETKTGQHPYATVIACSDSRVPVEHVFDAGIGDIFVIRVAGNVCDTDEIGSIEYGIGHVHTPVLVVLGHTSCGAVTAVVEGAEVSGSIPPLVDNIKPAVERTRAAHPDLTGSDLVNQAVISNVWQGIEDLLKRSPEARHLVEKDLLTIQGAVYHIESGKIEWLGEHPHQSDFLETHHE